LVDRFDWSISTFDIYEHGAVCDRLAGDGVHATVLREWRTQALKGMASIFERRDDVAALKTTHTQQVDELYAEIGRLTTQVNWLKKKLPASLIGPDER